LRRLDVGFDEKHLRITYPLRDIEGTLLGISGRTVVDAHPKYRLYDWEYADFGLPKRRAPQKEIVLWNGHNVYPAQMLAPAPSPIILVEGFKACMRMLQHGFKDTAAILGSYLSDHHIWMLERMGGPVYLMLDGDKPGQAATYLAGLSVRSLPVYVVQYPAQQPDQLTQEQAEESVASAISWHRWVLDQKKKGNHDVLRQKRAAAPGSSQLPAVPDGWAGGPSAFDRQR
jgi:DNA primase